MVQIQQNRQPQRDLCSRSSILSQSSGFPAKHTCTIIKNDSSLDVEFFTIKNLPYPRSLNDSSRVWLVEPGSHKVANHCSVTLHTYRYIQ